MTGPAALTRVEQLDAIGDAVGRKLRFQEISPEAFQQEMSKSMPPPVIEMLLDYGSDTATKPEAVVPIAQELTGRSRSLAEWARDHAAAFGAGSWRGADPGMNQTPWSSQRADS